MTMIAFTYPHTVDGYIVAEYDGSVQVAPLRCRDPEAGWRLTDWTLDGMRREADGMGSYRDVPMPADMIAGVTEWIENDPYMRDRILEAVRGECQDRREREWEAEGERFEYLRQRRKDEPQEYAP